MERDSDRQKQMEGNCSTGQGSQRAVVPMEEEEEEEVVFSTQGSPPYILYSLLCNTRAIGTAHLILPDYLVE